MATSTKHARKPVNQAKTTAAPAASAQTSITPPACLPYFNPNETSQTHELVIDAVSDLLAHGGHADDVDSLLVGAMRHVQHRELDDLFSDDPDKRDAIIDRRIDSGLEAWKTDLAIAWRKNKRSEPPAIEPATISGRIREQTRDVLRDRFEDFMRDGTPEEVHLLSEILGFRDSGIVGGIEGVDEIPLGEAFAYHLGNNETYIRIPRGFRRRIQNYIDALRAVDGKAVA